MAITRNGANGAFSGKVGSIIGYELNGKNIIRGLSKARKKPFTKGELMNQAKMKAVSRFLSPLKNHIKRSYQHVAQHSNIGPFQLAQSFHYKHALGYDVNGEPFLNPAKAILSRGPLSPPENCRVEVKDSKLYFTWNPSPGISDVDYRNDLLFVMLYNGQVAEPLSGGGRRADGTYFWDYRELHTNLIESTCHVYASFVRVPNGPASDSVFVGSVTLPSLREKD